MGTVVLKIIQFLFGVGLLVFAVYGWKILAIHGFLMFLMGALGICISCSALECKCECTIVKENKDDNG